MPNSLRPRRRPTLVSRHAPRTARKGIIEDWPRRMADNSVTEFMRHVLTGRHCSLDEIAHLKQIVDACGK